MPNITTRASKGSALTHNQLDANFTRTVSQKTTTYQILSSDNRSVIEGNHASTPFTVTLPTVATAAAEDTGDFEVTVTNINSAVVSVDGSGSETIDGLTNVIALEQWESVTLKLNSAGTGWKSIAQYQRKLRPVADTAAGDNAALGYSSTEGAVLTGQGSSTDVIIKNDADGEVISIPTGTTNINIRGNIDLGASGNAGQIVHQTNGQSIQLGGGASTTTGGGLALYAADHGTFPGDVLILNDGAVVAQWDESAGTWTLLTGTGAKTTAFTLDATQSATIGNGTQAATELRVDASSTGDPAIELQQGGAEKGYLRYLDSGDILRLDSDGQVVIASANTAAITVDTSQNVTFAAGVGEEGTFTASLTGTTSGSWAMTFDELAYTKIGRLVHIQGRLVFSTPSSPVGDAQIANLPFATTAELTDNAEDINCPIWASGLSTAATGYNSIMGRQYSASSSSLLLLEIDGTSAVSEIISGTTLNINFCYIAAT